MISDDAPAKNFDEFDLRIEVQKVRDNPATFVRLHALVDRGYRAQLGTVRAPDLIWLTHPIGPRLILYPDGKIVSLDKDSPLHDGEHDRDRIFAEDAEDDERFGRWLHTIDLPGPMSNLAAMSVGTLLGKTVIFGNSLCFEYRGAGSCRMGMANALQLSESMTPLKLGQL